MRWPSWWHFCPPHNYSLEVFACVSAVSIEHIYRIQQKLSAQSTIDSLNEQLQKSLATLSMKEEQIAKLTADHGAAVHDLQEAHTSELQRQQQQLHNMEADLKAAHALSASLQCRLDEASQLQQCTTDKLANLGRIKDGEGICFKSWS